MDPIMILSLVFHCLSFVKLLLILLEEYSKYSSSLNVSSHFKITIKFFMINGS